MDVQLFWYHLLKRQLFSPVNSLHTFAKVSWFYVHESLFTLPTDLSVCPLANSTMPSLQYCYGLNVCFSSKSLSWSSNSSCGGIRKWGLWEMQRSWGWTFMNGIGAVIRRDMREMISPTLVLSAMWGHSKDVSIYKRVRGLLPDIKSTSAMILDFSGSRTVWNKFQLLKSPSRWYFLIIVWAD